MHTHAQTHTHTYTHKHTYILHTRTHTQFHRHALIFSDVQDTTEGCVNKISCKLNGMTGLPKPYFKAMCSSEDETLLFPAEVCDSFCQQIVLCMAEKHPSKR